jgi:L-threonylcarbamoyladenylate synthase
MILEGGPAHVGIESTIVDLSRLDSGIGPVLLRPGHVTSAQIAAVLGVEPGRPDAAAPQVSGSLKAHYAPHTPLLLLPLEELLLTVFGDATHVARGSGRVAAVVFNKPECPVSEKIDWHVCATDPDVYARDLYALLRHLDQQGYSRILMEQPPQTPAWQAVHDRIGRAAAAFDGS